MPKIDPVQPRMQDHSELYLRFSVPAVRDLRNVLMRSSRYESVNEVTIKRKVIPFGND